MKPNLEKRINDVAKELQKGTRTKDIISLFCTKWHLGERTVKLYVSKAREQAKRSIDEANEAAANDSKIQETESRLEALITKSEIIDGLVKIFQNKKNNIRPADQISAAKQISSMMGFDEPTKTDLSISGDIKAAVVIKLFEDQEPLHE